MRRLVTSRHIWIYTAYTVSVLVCRAESIKEKSTDVEGGSTEYPQSMFLNRNMKNNVCPYKPQFY